ncbi:TetR/AcrR family transcriptional regulator [Nocardia sp. NPDC052566]|uniref:TetR/AcrR family transcriptional regulator n=1 Tax=Nocardia sp. NPDC052566 TaxID=3364330 RepID=UPI0037C976C5
MSARRERILDAARGLIVREGYVSVSMHAIARAAGVTRPALYAEFGDRDDLFAALLDREEARVLEMAAASTPVIEPGTDPAGLVAEIGEAAVDIYLDLVLSAPETWQLVLMPGDGLPASAHERVERGRTEIRQRTESMIAMAAGLRDVEVDAELLSHAVISVSETAARLVLAEGGVERREALSQSLRWLSRRVFSAATASGK